MTRALTDLVFCDASKRGIHLPEKTCVGQEPQPGARINCNRDEAAQAHQLGRSVKPGSQTPGKKSLGVGRDVGQGSWQLMLLW